MRKELLEYLIRIGVDAEQAKGTLKQVSSAGAQVDSGLARAAQGTMILDGAFKLLSGTGRLLLDSIQDVTNSVDRLNTLSASTGLAVETVAGLEYAAAASGKSLEQLVPPELAKRIDETRRGTGEALVGFEKLGLATAIMRGELATADDVFRATIDALSRIDDPTQRAAAATQVFGEQGKQLLSAFSDQGDLEAYIARVDRYGTQVGPEAMAATAAWQRATADLNLALDGAKAAVIPLIPLLSKGIEAIASLTVGLTSMVKVSATNWLDDFAASGGNAFEVFKRQGVRAVTEGMDAIHGYRASTEDLSAELSTATSNMERYGTGSKEAHDAIVLTDDAIASLAESLGYEGEAIVAVDAQRQKEEAGRRASIVAIREQTKALDEQRAERERQTGLQFAANSNQTSTQIAKIVADLKLDPKIAEEIGQAFADEMAARADPIGTGIDSVAGTLLAVLGPIGPAISAIAKGQAVLDEISSTVAGLTATVEALPETLISIPELVVGLLDAVADLPMALVNAIPEIVLGLAEVVFKGFTLGFELVLKGLVGLFEALPGKLADGIADALRSILSEINPFDGDGAFLGTDLAAGKGDKTVFGLKVPFFEDGGDVTRTGLAYVHAGERVESVAEQAGRGQGTTVNVNVVAQDPRVVVEEIRRSLGGYGSGLSLIGGL